VCLLNFSEVPRKPCVNWSSTGSNKDVPTQVVQPGVPTVALKPNENSALVVDDDMYNSGQFL
jgi:hypothetical protein